MSSKGYYFIFWSFVSRVVFEEKGFLYIGQLFLAQLPRAKVLYPVKSSLSFKASII